MPGPPSDSFPEAPPGPLSAAGSRAPRRVAALLTGAQAVALTAFAGFYLYELVVGEGSDATRVLMSGLLILLGALGLAALARGWLGAGSWPRTPTIVWSVLLLPVGLGLVQGERVLVGWLVIVVGIVACLAAVTARDPDTVVGPGGDVAD